MKRIPADLGAILLNEPVAWKPERFAIASELPSRVRRGGEAMRTSASTSLLCAPFVIFDLNLGAINL